MLGKLRLPPKAAVGWIIDNFDGLGLNYWLRLSDIRDRPVQAAPVIIAHLATLPPGQEVVAYCRGPYCVLAFEAVAQLRAHGFNARRLEEGFPEWKTAGLPVEEGAAEESHKVRGI